MDVEHIFSVQSIIGSAHEYCQPLTPCFIDLKNAFSSIAHLYIHNILHFMKLPPEFTNYVKNLYSSSFAMYQICPGRLAHSTSQGVCSREVHSLLSYF